MKREFSRKDLLGILEWWPVDYREKLVLQLISWLKINVNLELAKKIRDPYIRSMIYVVHLADQLVSRGFRILYANFSWLEFR